MTKNVVSITGSSFYDSPVCPPKGAKPLVDWTTGNVLWPLGYTEQQAAAWRQEHNCPGREWNPNSNLSKKE